MGFNSGFKELRQLAVLQLVGKSVKCLRQITNGSVNRDNSYRKSNKMSQCIKILFLIYMKLNMFRAVQF